MTTDELLTSILWLELFGALTAAWLSEMGYRRMRLVAAILIMALLVQIAVAGIIAVMRQR